jgi:cobalt-zinc-cadmium efflux system outer membrane protein
MPPVVFTKERILAAMAALLAALASLEADAQPSEELPSPLRVADVVALARTHRAEIRAARARASAAAQRPASVSALPDPMVMVSADHIPYSLHGVDANAVVQFDFPLSRVRRNRRLAAEADARRETSEVGRTELDVELEAARAFYMLDERQRTAVIVEEQLALARRLADIAQAHYAAGHGSLAETLRIQGEVERLAGERQGIDAEIQAAEAMLNAAIGREAARPLPPLAARPSLSEPPPAEVLVKAALSRRPELAGLQYQLDRAHTEIDVMRSMYRPMAFVRTGPAYTALDGPGWMAMVGLSLPVWQRKLRAGVEEARQMAAMSHAELQAANVMIEGEAVAARATVEAWRRRAVAIAERVLPPANQAVVAATASYGAGQLALVTVLEAMRALFEARMQGVMAEVNLGLAWARLERATGQLGGEK